MHKGLQRKILVFLASLLLVQLVPHLIANGFILIDSFPGGKAVLPSAFAQNPAGSPQIQSVSYNVPPLQDSSYTYTDYATGDILRVQGRYNQGMESIHWKIAVTNQDTLTDYMHIEFARSAGLDSPVNLKFGKTYTRTDSGATTVIETSTRSVASGETVICEFDTPILGQAEPVPAKNTLYVYTYEWDPIWPSWQGNYAEGTAAVEGCYQDIDVQVLWGGTATPPDFTVELKNSDGVLLETKTLISGKTDLKFQKRPKFNSDGTRINHLLAVEELNRYDSVVTVLEPNHYQWKVVNKYKLLNVPDPTQYITDDTGTYPVNYTESGNVRNPLQAEYEDALLDKTATAAAGTDEFYIDLKVTGKSVGYKTTDIIIVLDNSNSMGRGNPTLATIARDALNDFSHGLLDSAYNPGGNVKMALITYAGDVFDGSPIAVPMGSNVYTLNNPGNYCYKNFTATASDIINRIPVNIPDDRYTYNYFGATFTQAGLYEAGLVAAKSTADNQVVIHIGDGDPTRSFRATSVAPNTGPYPIVDYQGTGLNTQYIGTEFLRPSSRTNWENIKGNGRTFYLVNTSADGSCHTLYTVGGFTVGNHGFATMSEAKLLQQQGIEIYSLGIQLEAFTDSWGYTVSVDQIKNVLKNLGSSEEHYFDIQTAADFSDSLELLRKKFSNAVYNGKVTDPMGEKVRLVLGENNVFLPATGNTLDDGQYFLTASNQSLLAGIQVTANNGTIEMAGLNLGEGQWVNLRYSVKLKNDVCGFADDYYYQTNMRTTLVPNTELPDIIRDFPIPSVKGISQVICIEGEKTWAGDQPENRPNSITVQLFRSGDDALIDSKWVLPDENDAWHYSFHCLPRFDEEGKEISYYVQEVHSVDLEDYVSEVVGYNIINTYRPLGSLIINKVDENADPLAEAEFNLYAVTAGGELGEVVRAGTTPASGRLVFAKVPQGEYKLVETSAPEGYNLPPGAIPVTISSEKLHVEIEVTNVPLAKFPAVGGKGIRLYIVTGLLLMAAAVLISYKRFA